MGAANFMKATITVIRKTEYSSIVEMPEEKFKDLQSRLGSRDRSVHVQAERDLNKLIDVRDWQDDELDSVENFEEFKEE